MTSRIPRVIPASSHEGITDGIAAQPTEDSLWLGAEGVTTNSSVSRTVAIDPAHDTYIAGTAAVPNAQTTPSTNLPEGNSKMKSGVSLKDKIVGQAKIVRHVSRCRMKC